MECRIMEVHCAIKQAALHTNGVADPSGLDAFA